MIVPSHIFEYRLEASSEMASRLFLLSEEIAIRDSKGLAAALISKGASPRRGGLVASWDHILTPGRKILQRMKKTLASP